MGSIVSASEGRMDGSLVDGFGVGLVVGDDNRLNVGSATGLIDGDPVGARGEKVGMADELL